MNASRRTLSTSRSMASTSAKALGRDGLASITGLDASAPDRLAQDAVPLEITRDQIALRPCSHRRSPAASAMARTGTATPGE